MRPRIDRRGLTLVELMVTVALFGVISTVVIGFLTGSRETYADTSSRAEYQQSMRAVFSLIAREVRSAGCDPAETGLARLAICDDAVLHCRMDLDGDGSTLGENPDEDIRYTYDAASRSLQRAAAGRTVTILRGVTDVQFRYFAQDGTPLLGTPLGSGARDQVHFVEVAIAGELRSGEPVSYGTRIYLRNG